MSVNHGVGCCCQVCMPTNMGPFITDDFGPVQPLPKLGVDEGANPKTLTGRLKVPVLTVVPAPSIIAEAVAMRYGAFEAPRVDGGKGYGPYNFREKAIEAMTYIDAALRHCMAWVDGEEAADDSHVPHLWHAKASLGILIDAIERNHWTDNRPTRGTAAAMLARFKQEIKK